MGWNRSNQNNYSQRFSELSLINQKNVKNLKVAWIYNSNDGIGQIQSNPIIVEDKIITPTPGHYVVAINSKSGELVINNVKDETKQVMENLKAVLNTANLDFTNVVKTSIFITSMNDFNDINDVYGSYFEKGQEPARETVEVAKLPAGVNVEISMIAIN